MIRHFRATETDRRLLAKIYELRRQPVSRHHGEAHLTVLDGGVEDPLAGVAAARRSDTGQALRHGDQPLRVAGDEQPGAHPPTFKPEEIA